MRSAGRITGWQIWFVLAVVLLGTCPALAGDRVVVIPLNSGKGKPMAQVVTVSSKNGDFTNPIAALNSITDAGSSKPYVIVIGPGEYNLTETLVMKPWVSVYGAGRKATILSFTGVSIAIKGADNCELAHLTVDQGSSVNDNTGMENVGVSPRVHDVRFIVYNGTSISAGMLNYQYADPVLENVSIEVSSTSGSSTYGISTDEGLVTLKDVRIDLDIEAGRGYGLLNEQGGRALVDQAAIIVKGTGSASEVYGAYVADSLSELDIRRSIIYVSGDPATVYGLYAATPSSLTVSDTDLRAQNIRGNNTTYGLYVTGNDFTATLARTSISSSTRISSGNAVGIYADYGVELSASEVSVKTSASGNAVGLQVENSVDVSLYRTAIRTKSSGSDAMGITGLNNHGQNMVFDQVTVDVEAAGSAYGLSMNTVGDTQLRNSTITASGSNSWGLYMDVSYSNIVVSNCTITINSALGGVQYGIYSRTDIELRHSSINSFGASLAAAGSTIDAYFSRLQGTAIATSAPGGTAMGTLHCVYTIKNDGTQLDSTCQ